MIRNYLTCESEVFQNGHGGIGEIFVHKVFRRTDFKGGWDFALRVVMPPNSSMGVHQHEQNEEMYILLKGEGLMTIEGNKQRVGVGDMILNKPEGTHGLFNDSDRDIELLIVQASIKTL